MRIAGTVLIRTIPVSTGLFHRLRDFRDIRYVWRKLHVNRLVGNGLRHTGDFRSQFGIGTDGHAAGGNVRAGDVQLKRLDNDPCRAAVQ